MGEDTAVQTEDTTVQTTEPLHLEDVTVSAGLAVLGDTSVRLSDIKHVVFNSDTQEGNGISAAAVIKARAPDSYSNVSGLDNYETLEVVFADDAKTKALELIKAIVELRIPVMRTELIHDTFKNVFLESDKTTY